MLVKGGPGLLCVWIGRTAPQTCQTGEELYQERLHAAGTGSRLLTWINVDPNKDKKLHLL